MRAYSERKLLQAEIKGHSPFIKLITPSKVSMKVTLPEDIYFRVKNLCDDVSINTDTLYKPDDLLQLLLHDIIDRVRATQDVKGMHQLFLARDKSTINVRLKHYKNKLEEVEPLYPMEKPKRDDDFKEVFMGLDRGELG